MKVDLIAIPPAKLKELSSRLRTMGFVDNLDDSFFFTFLVTNISKHASHQLYQCQLFNIKENKLPIKYEKGFSYTVPPKCKDVKFDWKTIDPKTEETVSSMKITYAKAMDYIRNMYFTFLKNNGGKGAELLLPQGVNTQLLMTTNVKNLRKFIKNTMQDPFSSEEVKELTKLIFKIVNRVQPDSFKDLIEWID